MLQINDDQPFVLEAVLIHLYQRYKLFLSLPIFRRRLLYFSHLLILLRLLHLLQLLQLPKERRNVEVALRYPQATGGLDYVKRSVLEEKQVVRRSYLQMVLYKVSQLFPFMTVSTLGKLYLTSLCVRERTDRCLTFAIAFTIHILHPFLQLTRIENG